MASASPLRARLIVSCALLFGCGGVGRPCATSDGPIALSARVLGEGEPGPLSPPLTCRGTEVAAAPLLPTDAVRVAVEVRNDSPFLVSVDPQRTLLLDGTGQGHTPWSRDAIVAAFSERCPAWRPDVTPLPKSSLADGRVPLVPHASWSGYLVFDRVPLGGAELALFELPLAYDAAGPGGGAELGLARPAALRVPLLGPAGR